MCLNKKYYMPYRHIVMDLGPEFWSDPEFEQVRTRLVGFFSRVGSGFDFSFSSCASHVLLLGWIRVSKRLGRT